MTESNNPLLKLAEFGQAIWLDDIHRDLITSGDLKRLIEEDGLRGMTSNPAIFKKAIADSDDYNEDLRKLREEGKPTAAAAEAVMVKDVQMAADVFRPLYDRSSHEHGFVSLEVNPHLARDTHGTIEEARRLWASVDRPNVFIKVPGTAEGLPAITELISEGINVNVTLLFGLPRYREVAEAHAAGLQRRLERDESATDVHSVASFFLSRIDVLIDPKLEELMKKGDPARAEQAKACRGEVAIASAKLAYEIHQGVLNSERWQPLAKANARPQNLLWASTSTKNPDYSDVKYVESLIGVNTINTLPMETLEAYRDHGQPQPRLTDNVDHARRVLEQLPALDIDLDQATRQLEEEGIEKFVKPYDELLKTLEKEMASV